MLHNFNADGFDSLASKYGGGRPPKFTLPQRQEIKKTAPRGWSMTSAMRACACCSVRRASALEAVKTWKTSTDPDWEAKKNRVLELYAIADGKAKPGPGDPTVSMCMDEFGPLNLMPHPGTQ